MTSLIPVGQVLRASTVGFAVGCSILEQNTPCFGDLVKVYSLNDRTIFGLVYDVQVRDDPAVRQLIMAGGLEPEAILDQRTNRLVPIEINVLVVGYEQANTVTHGLPPQPPLTLDNLIMCDDADWRRFVTTFDYFRLVLRAPQIPVDELLITHLGRAAQAQAPEKRRAFLVTAGRELARLMGTDIVRLDNILKRIKPISG